MARPKNAPPKAPKKPKRELSPEARQKLSEAAKKRVAEGKMGGAKFGKLGGRPRKPRASQKVAEAAQKEAEDILDVFRDGISPDKPMGTRLKAAELWLSVEEKESKLALQEEKLDADNLSRDEIIKALAEGLSQGAVAAMIASQLHKSDEPIVDADVVEDDASRALESAA